MYNKQFKTNDNKYNNNKRERAYNNRPRREVSQETFTKEFDSFKEGFVELLNEIPDIEEMLFSIPIDINKLEYSYESFIKAKIVELVLNNIPEFGNKETIFFDLKIAANQCSIKTNKYVAFGWFNRKNKDNTNTYIFKVTIFNKKYNSSWDLVVQ